ncbi:DUF2202 domain-containing protein [Candidatus Saccharibacteria bacterium]|nr:DUF2202 domain-containing protein [Candidatus Saccharibacteria bacterium]
MKTISLKIAAITVAGILVALGAMKYLAINNEKVPVTDADTTNQPIAEENKAAPTLASKSTEEQLLYLVEEEKLAHDVYTVMYQKYGASIFGNILKSESTHQEMVLALLQVRNIADPSSREVGVFRDKDLQTLYDTLIAQGNINITEAYKVGVTIEEKDIADISAQLSTAADDDVIAALESLRSGSENHLRAFNRQL